MELILMLLLLLSPSLIFSAELQLQELHAIHIIDIVLPETSSRLSLQELCMNVIVTNRVDSRTLCPYLQSEIARKENVYLKEAQHRETERRRLLDRLQEASAYEPFNDDIQDDPDHISQLFPTLHNQYLTGNANSSYFKKCLACLAAKRITPGHSIRCLGKGCIYSVGISAALSPVIFVPTVICCPPMTDPILKGFLCFFASGITCSYLSKAARNHCNRHTQRCYNYLTEPDEAPRAIVMAAYLDPEVSFDECTESTTLL